MQSMKIEIRPVTITYEEATVVEPKAIEFQIDPITVESYSIVNEEYTEKESPKSEVSSSQELIIKTETIEFQEIEWISSEVTIIGSPTVISVNNPQPVEVTLELDTNVPGPQYSPVDGLGGLFGFWF